MNGHSHASFSADDVAAQYAQLERTNPQLLARLRTMNPEQMESAREHLLAALEASRSGEHGHAHTHSSSCRHGPRGARFMQPPPPTPPPQAPPDNEMNAVQAVQYNRIERLKALIESGAANVNTPDDERCYLLHWASINNHVDLIRYLISKGATVDIKGGDLDSTPLHWACRQGCTEAFMLLVDNGAAIDSVDKNSIQAIHLASQYGQIKILAFLLGSGVDVDCKDNRGFTPLIYSALGPPPNYIPSSGSLHSCTQLLLTFGADINYQEPTRRYSALHFAISNHNTVSLHVLLKNPHVNVSLTTNDNADAYDTSLIQSNKEAQFLLDLRHQSSKTYVRPALMQRFCTNEWFRKWATRFYLFLVVLMFGLSANAYNYPYWLRLIVPIVATIVTTQIFNYYVFDDHTKDNLAFSYVLSLTIFMYTTYILYLQEYRWTIEDIFYHIFTVYGLYCIRCIKKVNPGFLRDQLLTIDGHNMTREKMCIAFARDPQWTFDHFCVSCLIRRPLRSKHCPVDKSCVAKFDHHCAWLDACIGGRNYFYFIRVICCGSLALVIFMHRVFLMVSTDLETFTLKSAILELYDPWFVYMVFFSVFNTFWVSLMTLFHLYNSIVLGVTLNERLIGFRYDYFHNQTTGQFQNPFRGQILKNLLETFGLFRLMSFFRYTRIDWSQIYDINQIHGLKKC